MSYNCGSVKCLKLDAYVTVKDAREILEEHLEDAPGVSFLEDLKKDLDRYDEAKRSLGMSDDDGARVVLKNFDWCGEGSGRGWDLLKEEIAPRIRGRVEAVFTWEDGDSHTGLIVDDGRVTECDVTFALAPRRV